MSREDAAGKAIDSIRKFGRSQWLALALLGLLLVVIAMPAGERDSPTGAAGMTADSALEEDTEVSAMERELAGLLEEVEGVGKVQVMICPENAQDSSFFSGTESASIGGALIVAEGADDPVTVQKIRRAVQALFQIESHKIEVMKMK